MFLDKKGENDCFTPEFLKTCCYFDAETHREDNQDITVVLGTNEEGESTLLMCRFHHLKASTGRYTPRELLTHLQHNLPANDGGLERMRGGGSNGKISYSDELKYMMATPNSSPRKSKGVIFLRMKNDLKFALFYIGTKDEESTVKRTWYGNPKPGGNFVMKEYMFEEFKFLQQFVSTKPLCAQLLKYLSSAPIAKKAFKKLNMKSPNIAQIAVTNELQNVECAKDFLRRYVREYKENQKKDLSQEDQKKAFYSFYAEHFVHFTLVMHAVGLHLDHFAQGEQSLENRVCFSFPLDGGKHHIKIGGKPYGRGGMGLERYTFALLDWKGWWRRRRQMWTLPQNQHIAGSNTHVRNETGQQNARLTVGRWGTFITNAVEDGNYVLPAGVENLNGLNPRQDNNNL